MAKIAALPLHHGAKNPLSALTRAVDENVMNVRLATVGSLEASDIRSKSPDVAASTTSTQTAI